MAKGSGMVSGCGSCLRFQASTLIQRYISFFSLPLSVLKSFFCKIRHLQSKLSLRLRTLVTRYTHDLYLSSFPDLRYYRSGLEGVEQYVTSDIEAWSEALSGL